MIERTLIDIPDHPTEPYKRKAQVFRLDLEYDTNRVILRAKVYHYNLSGREVTHFKTDKVRLIGGIGIMVNKATGVVVTKNALGKYPNNSVPEFDYLYDIVNVKKLFTLEQLEEMYIPMRIDKFNEQLYT